MNILYQSFNNKDVVVAWKDANILPIHTLQQASASRL